jgi:hypothetical protein
LSHALRVARTPASIAKVRMTPRRPFIEADVVVSVSRPMPRTVAASSSGPKQPSGSGTFRG